MYQQYLNAITKTRQSALNKNMKVPRQRLPTSERAQPHILAALINYVRLEYEMLPSSKTVSHIVPLMSTEVNVVGNIKKWTAEATVNKIEYEPTPTALEVARLFERKDMCISTQTTISNGYLQKMKTLSTKPGVKTVILKDGKVSSAFAILNPIEANPEMYYIHLICGKQYMKYLMAFLLLDLNTQGIQRVRLSSVPATAPWYWKNFGFVPDEDHRSSQCYSSSRNILHMAISVCNQYAYYANIRLSSKVSPSALYLSLLGEMPLQLCLSTIFRPPLSLKGKGSRLNPRNPIKSDLMKILRNDYGLDLHKRAKRDVLITQYKQARALPPRDPIVSMRRSMVKFNRVEQRDLSAQLSAQGIDISKKSTNALMFLHNAIQNQNKQSKTGIRLDRGNSKDDSNPTNHELRSILKKVNKQNKQSSTRKKLLEHVASIVAEVR